jgi:endonuclease YncB( thermonuclease family)
MRRMTFTSLRPFLRPFLLLPVLASGGEHPGRVVRVVDGDTLVGLDASNTQHKFRLAGIDCPERKQPWGERAKQGLSGYVFGRAVTVDWSKLDRYG